MASGHRLELRYARLPFIDVSSYLRRRWKSLARLPRLDPLLPPRVQPLAMEHLGFFVGLLSIVTGVTALFVLVVVASIHSFWAGRDRFVHPEAHTGPYP